MIVKLLTKQLLTKQHLEFLSLTGGCRGSSESTLVKMSNYWKSHAAAHILASLGSSVGLVEPFTAANPSGQVFSRLCRSTVAQW